MTRHNEIDHDIDGSPNDPVAAEPESDSPEGASPGETAKASSEAETIIHEARRVEAEAEALIAEALQYQQDILKRLQVCFESLSAASDVESVAEDIELEKVIAAGYMAEATDKDAGQTSDSGLHDIVSPFIEAMSMGNTSSTKTELVDQILAGSTGIKAAEAAIQCAFEVFMNEAANQMSILVKNNTLYPEIREDMLKLEKRVMAMTLEAIDSIQARVPEQPNPKAKSDS